MPPTSGVAVTLIAHVCDQIRQSHSAVRLPTIWRVRCSAGLREDQTLPELAVPFSPCNRSSAHTSNAARPPPFFCCELTNYFYQKMRTASGIITGDWLNNSTLGELVEQSKKTKSGSQAWFPHHWPLHRDCSVILMAPVSVLMSKPIWLSLAPHSLESGPALGQLCSMSKHVRDFLLGFPVERRGD